MEWIVEINNFLGNFDNIIGSLGLIVAVIGIIVGIIGKKELTEAKRIVNKIENSNVNNSQFAKVIKNEGNDYINTKEIVKDLVEPKLENKPDIYMQDEKPESHKKGDIWI